MKHFQVVVTWKDVEAKDEKDALETALGEQTDLYDDSEVSEVSE